MKKTTIPLMVIFLFTMSATRADAKWFDFPDWKRETKEEIKQVKNEIKNEAKKYLGGVVENAKIISLAGSSLPTTIIVNKDGKNITLNITSETILVRKFGGKSSLAEIKVDHLVNAKGIWTDESKTVLETKTLRDISIQKRNATFWGKIKSIAGDVFVLTIINRGDQTVKPNESTKITNIKEVKVAFSDLKVGDRVRVSGVWDSALKIVEEVKTIKDWSLTK